jgi:hypothetical protein
MLILTHVGSDIPAYLKYTFQQLRIHNPEIEIVMLASEDALDKEMELIKKYRIKGCHIEYFQDHPRLKEFKKLSWYGRYGKPNTTYPSPDNFVQGTSERLFVLDAFISYHKIDEFFHCENDIMIYCDLDKVMDVCEDKEGLMVTPMSDIDITCAMMYCRHREYLAAANDFMLKQLAKGDQAVRAEFGMPMVHEMSLLKEYGKLFPENLGSFPILPEQVKDSGFNMVFDPASYGQYLGGTNCGHGDGFTDKQHYAGQRLRSGEIQAYLCNRLPHAEQHNSIYPLANLHVHSKDLKRFLTHE